MPDLPDLASRTPDHFEAVEGQTFEARPLAGEKPFTLVLTGVRRRRGPPGFREPFSLELLGRPLACGQGMCRLWHPRLGDLEVFLVPVGASDAGVAYEVSFG
jgi:hypothetical protein